MMTEAEQIAEQIAAFIAARGDTRTTAGEGKLKPEHLLVALAEDPDAMAVLDMLAKLPPEVLAYLDNKLTDLVPPESLKNALRAIHVQLSGREKVTSADLLIAIAGIKLGIKLLLSFDKHIVEAHEKGLK